MLCRIQHSQKSRWYVLCGALVSVLFLFLRAQAGEKEKTREIGRWYPEFETGITLSQSAFSDNWAGGDKGSVVWTAILNATLERQVNRQVNWYNILKVAYGQTHQQTLDGEGRRIWQRPEKSTDLIDYETIARFTLGGWVDPYASARFESQFQDASDPSGRTLSFNPMKWKESGGVARELFDDDKRNLLMRFGFTFRQSRRRLFQNDAPDPATRSNVTNDGGIEWVTDYKGMILNDRVSWTSKLNVYHPVFYSDKRIFDAFSDARLRDAGVDPNVGGFAMTTDIDWENIFTAQITRIISVNVYLLWVFDKYDNTVSPRTAPDGSLANAADVRAAIRKAGQLKQTMAIGITYRLL